jgi:hypothetical protein
VYNETVFKTIDYILDQMRQSGIRVIVALTDYWKTTDGVQQVRNASPRGVGARAESTSLLRSTEYWKVTVSAQ